MKKTDIPIKLIFEYPCAKDVLWKAISSHSEMIQWYFENLPDFQLEVGFETKFPVKSEDRTFTHLWKVTDVASGSKLTYVWKYAEYPGEAEVTFELIEKGESTELILTLEVKESFPEDIPEFTRESCINGWNYFLGENLIIYLNS